MLTRGIKKVNPWAICHAQLGKKKTNKFERCVMKVKAKHGLKEDAEYIEKFLGEAGISSRPRGQDDPARARPGLGKQQLAGRIKALAKIRTATGPGGSLGGGKTPEERTGIRKKAKKTYARRVVGTHVGKHGPEPRATPDWAAELVAVERTEGEGPSIAEITQEYIRRARDADIARHKKKYDTLQSISKERSSTRGYAAGRFVTKQDATWKKGKKLLAINKRRTAEREAAKKK